jgi:hypothetical protein
MLRTKLALAISLPIGGLWLLAVAACTASPQKVDFVVLDQDIPIDQIHVSPTSTPLPKALSMSLAEAAAAVPFAINPPAWVPDGFQLVDTVEVTSGASGARVDLSWQDTNGATINLTLSTGAASETRLAAAGTDETISLNGKPATLRRSTGLGSSRLVLTWTSDDLAYRLAAPADALDTAGLIRMAESIP